MPLLYICLCNALTDRKLKQAATATGSTRPGEIYAACGCRAQCGQCARAVLQLLRDHASQAAEQLQGAD
jgi:bacterioferritin-associated ferredoxin